VTGLGYRWSVTTASSQLDVGGYRLLHRIGEGGMGVVHLAQAPDGRRVALKVLRPHIVGDEEARERLAREVASLRRVRSPRIAEVIDADPHGETPFVATRYVPGISLHQLVRDHGPVRGSDLDRLAAGLAEAVIAVHAVGVLHRDVKPSNVLLEGRSPVLIDFGLARVAEDPRLTHTGWLLGTPGYLAPEILYGDDATTASDVHSWAATVAFAATGCSPYGSGPAMAIMDRVRRGEHDLSQVPADLAPLLRACLSLDPAQRPTMSGVLAALRGSQRLPVDDLTVPLAIVAEDHDPTRMYTAQPQMLPWRPPPRGLPRLQRGLLLGGLTGLVATGFAAAPYMCVLVAALLALAVRTFSWTTESARERQLVRGRRRWYDGPLTVLSSPWYAVVATAGTLVLVGWAAGLAALTGSAYALFGRPIRTGLLLMGLVLALSLWWGPGSRRVRVPTRRAIVAVTRHGWSGWLAVGLLAAGVALCGYALTDGVSWDPAAGAPWRHGTVLGDLVRWL
jgi:predicted Ser/Thr protein kinase